MNAETSLTVDPGGDSLGFGTVTTQIARSATHRFAFADRFHFRGELICRVESYLVPLAEPEAPSHRPTASQRSAS